MTDRATNQPTGHERIYPCKKKVYKVASPIPKPPRLFNEDLIRIDDTVMSQRVRESDFIDQLRSIYIPEYRAFQIYKLRSQQRLQDKYILIK